MPGDEGQSFGLLCLREPQELPGKFIEDELHGGCQRMFRVSSAAIRFTPNCGTTQDRTGDGAENNAGRESAGDSGETVQAAGDRFQTRFAGLCEPVAERCQRSRGQRRSVRLVILLICAVRTARFVIWRAFRTNSREELPREKSRSG